MNERAPFSAADLAEVDRLLLDRASSVVAMEDVFDGHRDPHAIGLRHDVDGTNNMTREALQTAVRLAEWEADRGYRSTYYILHTAPYWMAPGFAAALDRIAECGHEIGIHTDALAEGLRLARDPDLILDEALAVLRGLGFEVRGVAGHGNPICNRDAAPGEISFANDEQFVECARPNEGAPDRTITRGNVAHTLAPRPLADFGLDYEALAIAYDRPNDVMPFRISDSGGQWLNPGWQETVERWNNEREHHPNTFQPNRTVRQLHFLLHPDWWAQAFVPLRAAA